MELINQHTKDLWSIYLCHLRWILCQHSCMAAEGGGACITLQSNERKGTIPSLVNLLFICYDNSRGRVSARSGTTDPVLSDPCLALAATVLETAPCSASAGTISTAAPCEASAVQVPALVLIRQMQPVASLTVKCNSCYLPADHSKLKVEIFVDLKQRKSMLEMTHLR
ncbi:hypothetical protein PoB_005720800 [Plakobranchus ocellatus]|uniref:Uncharacterized protein n=1 Tax=Plakobranchus ocellatus TaxID=259542 RepID=A0AAV4CI07_9GAST|nr:hypothetical protein PoB_005720800 [Plakobranchus ocellatus]